MLTQKKRQGVRKKVEKHIITDIEGCLNQVSAANVFDKPNEQNQACLELCHGEEKVG